MLDKVNAVFQGSLEKGSKNSQSFYNATSGERWDYIVSSFVFVVVVVFFLFLGYWGKMKWPGMGWYIWLGINWVLLVLGIITFLSHVWMKIKGK